MDKTLGLLDGGGGGGRGGGGMVVHRTEEDYMGLTSAAFCYSNEAEIELGLGLSLGRGGAGVGKGKGARGEFGRILTAQDLPNGLTVRAPGSVSVGTKRAAAECVDHVEHGSSSPAVSQVVGWPPVGAHRMNNMVNQSKVPNVEEEEEEAKGVGGNEKKESSMKKMNCQVYGNDDNTKENGQVRFIKVNVDGLAIGRKVDLNAHASYESLARALVDMFFTSCPTIVSTNHEKEHLRRPPKLLDESPEFVLTYEDKEGDWMLVGDVPWGMFLCTVKRLRIMRTSEANTLARVPQDERRQGKLGRLQEH